MSAQDVIAALRSYFAGRGWPCEAVEDPPGLVVHHAWATPAFTSRATVTSGGRVVVYTSQAALPAPDDRRAEVSRYLGMVNRHLEVGSFELRWDTGEVRCKTSVDLLGASFDDDLMQGLLIPNHQAMVHYHGELLRVISGEVDAAEAFADAVNR